jgi:hypothetical protein
LIPCSVNISSSYLQPLINGAPVALSGDKVAEFKAGSSSPLSIEVKEGGAISPPPPLASVWRGAQLNKTKKLHGLSLRANYTDRATAACRRSDCQLLRIEGGTWSS